MASEYKEWVLVLGAGKESLLFGAPGASAEGTLPSLGSRRVSARAGPLGACFCCLPEIVVAASECYSFAMPVVVCSFLLQETSGVCDLNEM